MRKTSFKYVWMASAAVAVLVTAAHVNAKKKNTNTNNNKNNQPAQTPAPTPPPPSTPDKSAVSAAQQELKTATDALNAVIKKATDEFQTSDPFVQAKKEVATAQSEYDAAAAPVMTRVQSDPAYITAMNDNKSAHDQIAALRAAGDPPPDQIAPLAQQEMSSGSKARSIQSEALLADQAAVDAKSKLTTAQTALAALRDQFQKTLVASSEYTTAKQAVDDAQKKLSAAQTASAK